MPSDTINIDLIRGDKTADPKVVEVYESLKEFKDATARQEWVKERDENWDAVGSNKMWGEKELAEMQKKGQDPLVINRCYKGVQASCAIATDQHPEIKFFPIGSGDLYVAELLKRGHDYVWAKNEGNDVLYDMAEEHKIGGHGFIEARLDKSKSPFGSLIFEEVLPTEVYWDAKSRKRDYSDSHLIIAKERTATYIKDNYKGLDLTDKDLYFIPSAVTDATKSEGVTGEDNYAVGKADDIPEDVRNRQNVIWEIAAWMVKTDEQDFLVTLMDDQGMPLDEPKVERVEREKGERDEALKERHQMDDQNRFHWKRKVEVRELRMILGKKLVDTRTNPYGEDRDGNPILPIVGIKAQRTKTAYSKPPTSYALPLNREKNKRRSQAIYAAAMNFDAPIVRPNGTKWVGEKGTPGAELVVDKNAAFPPFRLTPGALDASVMFQLEQKCDLEIDDIYDTPDVIKGKIPQGQTQMAAKLGLALQDFAGMMSKPFMRQLESAMIRLARVNIAIMLKHWPRYMWERLLEDEERLKFAPAETPEADQMKGLETEDPNNPVVQQQMDPIQQQIAAKWEAALEKLRPKDPSKPPGISVLDIDVKIAAGSSMPTNRMAKMQTAIELTTSGIYDREAALEYIDDPNRDKIVARMKQMEQMQAEAAMTQGGKP